MSSVRNTIIDNIQTALETIKESGGFNTTVRRVTREVNVGLRGTWIDSDMPGIFINDTLPEIRLTPVGTDQRRTMVIMLEGAVSKPSGLSNHFNEFVADIRKVLHATDLGTNVITFHLTELDPSQGTTGIEFDQLLEITYYYPEASP